jgi:uncharacterized protein YndB with AHSA1/START domain
MLKRIVLVLLIAFLAFAAYVPMMPSQFSVARSAVIDAPPQAVFKQVNDFKKWEAWSPWAKRDPNAKIAFHGPPSGRGANFTWDGNDEVGKGSMTIEESIQPKTIEIELSFERPFPGTSEVGFEFEPVADGTKVTWTISGEQSYIERAFCLLMRLDMDEMIGKDYERGLANLKEVVEAEKPNPSHVGDP